MPSWISKFNFPDFVRLFHKEDFFSSRTAPLESLKEGGHIRINGNNLSIQGIKLCISLNGFIVVRIFIKEKASFAYIFSMCNCIYRFLNKTLPNVIIRNRMPGVKIFAIPVCGINISTLVIWNFNSNQNNWNKAPKRPL